MHPVLPRMVRRASAAKILRRTAASKWSAARENIAQRNRFPAAQWSGRVQTLKNATAT